MLAELVDAVVGVDTHRDTHQVEIALPNGAPIAVTTIGNDTTGYAELLAWNGIAAVDVPAKLAARVRVLSTGHGRKNDDADATSVAAQSAARLRIVTVDDAATALRALVEHRDVVAKTRTQTVNRLHTLLTQLLPAGGPRQLTADTATQLLRPVRPRSIAARTLRRLAAELITEIRHVDRRINVASIEITHAVQASRSTLSELRGPTSTPTDNTHRSPRAPPSRPVHHQSPAADHPAHVTVVRGQHDPPSTGPAGIVTPRRGFPATSQVGAGMRRCTVAHPSRTHEGGWGRAGAGGTLAASRPGPVSSR